MNKHTVSIALAAYNGAEFIAGQLQSLLAQTLQPDEIVISDDSSDEATFEAVKPFLSDKRFIYVKNSSNHGVAGNFENALRHTTSDYIFLCDQDDVWLPGKVEKLASVLSSDPAIDAVFCNSQAVDGKLRQLDYTLFDLRDFPQQARKALNAGNALKLFMQHIPISGHNIAFRRQWLEKLLPFPELTPFYPDSWIALVIAAAGKWYALDEIHTLYRVHQSNQSTPDASPLAGARQARKMRAAYRNALLAEEICQRFAGELSLDCKKSLQKFACFHWRRDTYAANILLRTLQVAFQLLQGNYCCYADSFKTAAADVLIAPVSDK